MPSSPYILVVFGTRPEAIKLAPVIAALRARSLPTTVCVTAQHRELLDDALQTFGVVPDIDLDLMAPDQDLSALTAKILGGMREVLSTERPDVVVVQGDTTSAMAAALAAYQAGVPVAHVEAGLRSGCLADPWPEEANRRIIAQLSALHFAPTETARQNLRAEGIADDAIRVTGNTGIDAACSIELVEPRFARPTVVVTCHRRENHADRFARVGDVLAALARDRPDLDFVCPAHPSPRVREPLVALAHEIENLRILAPLAYPEMLGAIAAARWVVTDSGGVQEEAAWFGTPCLVLREHIDRPESVASGNAFVIGFDRDLAREAGRALDDPQVRRRAAAAREVFGGGDAADRVAESLQQHFI